MPALTPMTLILSTLLTAVGLLHADEPSLAAFVERHCLDCHDSDSTRGGLDLTLFPTDQPEAHPQIWEHALRRLGARQMPPATKKNRPSEEQYLKIIAELTTAMDAMPADPGQLPALRRLTRTEYRNAIRDLLGISVDVAELLPKDESSHGFDNITVGSLSSTLLNRYVSAAQKISRIAIGGDQGSAQVRVVRVPADQTQIERVEGLPIGTRGGTVIEHTFPVSGDYEIEVRLTRDRNEVVEGLNGKHQILVLLDREQKAEFTVEPPPGRNDFTKVDAHLTKRISAEAGTHQLGVTFLDNSRSLAEIKRQPYDAQFNFHRHPRQAPAVFQVSILGPFNARPQKISPLISTPDIANLEPAAKAQEILKRLMRKAFRRSISAADLERPMQFFHAAESFDAGMEAALASILVSPQFLFKIEKTPTDLAPGSVYDLDAFALASRLAFFLWASLPDDELLDAAETGSLADGKIFESQVRRMLADPRAESLATNFANQWLQLRNLEGMSPDLRLFPDFDDNLRQSLIRETELHCDSVRIEDRPVMDLLTANYTFLNERLSRHYDIPHVIGSHFRQVTLDPSTNRGGLLRQGSILMLTSYANRTSPVIRGNWILDNVLGTPTPPPPPNIPALEDAVVDASLPMRARLAVHREDTSCATCHNLMDPIGFALENFDATGRWRVREAENQAVDASGGLPDGQKFVGVDGLEAGLQARPDLFARTLTEKLLTYALGRGIEATDAPAVRKIIRTSAENHYRFSDLVLGITQSVPFTQRKAPDF